MGSTLLQTLVTMPLTCAIMALCGGIWFYMWNRRVELDDVSLSYRKVVAERQYYRVVSAAFTHINFMHVAFNMGSLYSVGVLEAFLGSGWYAQTTLLLLAASMAIWLGIVHVAATRFGRAAWAEQPAVGYSGVIFGWMTILGLYQPSAVLAGMLPVTFAPFLSLILTQLIVPRASFLGHLSGIIAGYAIGWGGLDWARGYWLYVAWALWGGACVLSLRANQRLPAWVARWVSVSPAFLAAPAGAMFDDTAAGASGGAGAWRRYLVGGVLRVVRPVARDDIVNATAAAPAVPATPAAADPELGAAGGGAAARPTSGRFFGGGRLGGGPQPAAAPAASAGRPAAAAAAAGSSGASPNSLTRVTPNPAAVSAGGTAPRASPAGTPVPAAGAAAVAVAAAVRNSPGRPGPGVPAAGARFAGSGASEFDDSEDAQLLPGPATQGGRGPGR